MHRDSLTSVSAGFTTGSGFGYRRFGAEKMETHTAQEIRIYVACLAAYNNGKLHGRWIDATQGASAIRDEIQEMLSESPEPNAEEWAIHDYEGFGQIRLSESEDIARVAELAELIAEHGEAFTAFAEAEGADYATADAFQDRYCGEYGSEEEYAEQCIDDGLFGEIPEPIAPYLDVEKIARDLFINDYLSVDSPRGVYVFRRY
jgi:antirestriction protein